MQTRIDFDDLLQQASSGDPEAIRLLTDLVTSEQLPEDRMAEALRVLGKNQE